MAPIQFPMLPVSAAIPSSDFSVRRPAVRLVRAEFTTPAPAPMSAPISVPASEMNEETSSALTTTGFNWLQHSSVSNQSGPIPTELRDQIYDLLIPSEIVVRDGQRLLFSTDAKLLVVDRRSEEEFTKRLQFKSRHRFEFTSITELKALLDSLPLGYFDRIREFSITAKGPYNAHSYVYGQNGLHACNICPTLKVKGNKYHWEIELACSGCINDQFYRDELHCACVEILRKVTRVLRDRTLSHVKGQPGIDGITVTIPRSALMKRPYLYSELWGPRHHLPYSYR